MKRAKKETTKVNKRKAPVEIEEPVVVKVIKAKLKEPEILRWQKIGGGTLRGIFDGRYQIIKKNQKFRAKLSEIAEGFRNSLVCLDKEELKAQIKAGKIVFYDKEDLFTIEVVKKSGLYNIINKENKKALTKKPLEKEEAVKLMNSLNG